jgi:hypothetical protein
MMLYAPSAAHVALGKRFFDRYEENRSQREEQKLGRREKSCPSLSRPSLVTHLVVGHVQSATGWVGTEPAVGHLQRRRQILEPDLEHLQRFVEMLRRRRDIVLPWRDSVRVTDYMPGNP